MIEFNDRSDLAIERTGQYGEFLHQLQRIKTRVCIQRLRRGHRAGGQRQGTLVVVRAIGGQVLHARTQSQLKTTAQVSQINDKRAVTVDAGEFASKQPFLDAAVIHRKGLEIDWGVAASQGVKVAGLFVDAAAQQRLVHLRHQLKPRWRMRVHALAQRRTRGNADQAHQRTLKKCVVSKALNCIKVALAQSQQRGVAFEDRAVINARPQQELRVNQRIDVHASEVLADERQSSMRADVVEQFFDQKVDHVAAHLLGEQFMRAKLLISKGKQHIATFRSRIQINKNVRRWTAGYRVIYE